MSNLKTFEKPDISTPPKPQSVSQGWHWQWLLAPLMGVSVLLHVILLFVPMPTPPPRAEEAETEAVPEEEDAPIDILALSDIEAPELPAEPPPAEPAAQAAAPAASAPPSPDAVPAPPDPTQIPETFAESPPADQSTEASGSEETPPTSSFDPARQQALLGQTGGINSEFDQTEYFPVYAWNPSGNSSAYLASWDAQRLGCFFSSIEEMSYQLVPGADRLRFLSRNYGLIVNEDLPRTFPNQEIVQDPNGYCGEDFFVVNENGAPAGIYVSAIGVGPGSPPASIILIFWIEDPRS